MFHQSCLVPPTCPICYIQFDLNKRTPHILDCGHTFCQQCILKIIRTNPSLTITCTMCKEKSPIYLSLEGLGVRTNQNLMHFMAEIGVREDYATTMRVEGTMAPVATSIVPLELRRFPYFQPDCNQATRSVPRLVQPYQNIEQNMKDLKNMLKDPAFALMEPPSEEDSAENDSEENPQEEQPKAQKSKD